MNRYGELEEVISKTDLNAEWKRIQQKTFTRWCNEQLKLNNIVIEDLAKDLCDGVNLVVLLELLSHKKLGRYNKKPRIHAQRMENVDMVLTFITEKERIRLVNIGSGDIVEGNLKLILGLVWTLILHYQISVGFGIEEGVKTTANKLTPKQALLGYVQDKIPDKDIKNFTSNWNDGTAIAALVDSIAPGLCPEADFMESKNALENATFAMKLAEDWLGVPMVLGPEDMINPHVDELSMMTYISQFPEAKLKPGAPIKPKCTPSNVIVSGPGVEKEGVAMGIPAMFNVDTSNSGCGNLEIIVKGPDEELDVRVEDKKDGTYVCSYVPTIDGPHQVIVKWGNNSVKNSPFLVNVAPTCNALACRAYGPGVEGGNLKEGLIAEFYVETVGAGPGELEISVRGPKGPVSYDCINEDEDKFHVTYIPPSPGQYIVEVTFASLHIKDSPFKVRVDPDKPNASKCFADGPGIQDTLLVGEETWFRVHTKGAGRGELVINVRSPHGEVPIVSQEDKNVILCTYTPKESGELVITIKYGGEHIPGSRFRVQVKPPPDATKCIATGPGLAPCGVRVNEPVNFQVKTKEAGLGEVSVTIKGPSGELTHNVTTAPYIYDYTYTAPESGRYEVDINFAGKPIPGSVFPVAVTDSSKVKITGPGMKGELLPIKQPLKYIVDAQGAGPGVVACRVQMPAKVDETDSANTGPKVKQVSDGVFEIDYTPLEVGTQKMNATFGEAPIPGTPIKLNIYDASKVISQGPGLKNGNKTGEPTYFTVDMQQAGEGSLLVNCVGPVETNIFIKDQANDSVRCEYTPTVAGEYTINILYEDEHVPNSPFQIYVQPKTNPSAVKAHGPGIDPLGLKTDMLAEFFVDYSKAGEGDVQVSIQGPAGGVEYTEEGHGDRITKFCYHTDSDESGVYIIEIMFADKHIPNSPFYVPVTWKSDPNRVIAEGVGLQGGTTKEWVEFDLDLRKAGDGGISVDIQGPKQPKVEYDDHEDGTMTIQYYPVEPGEYNIDISFNNTHIPGSPFKPNFERGTDATKCKAFGPGLAENGVKVGDAGDFTIDTTEGGSGAVDVVVNGPFGVNNRRGNSPAAKPIITNNHDGTFAVVYNPRKVGEYNINVIFADEEIPNSPFTVNITDPTNVVIKGPGCTEVDNNDYQISKQLQWLVDCTQAGHGNLAAKMVNKRDEEESEDIVVSQVEDGVYQLHYQPKAAGTHQLYVTYSENPIKQSPVVAIGDSSKVRVYGPAFDGVKVGESAIFSVDYMEAGDGKLYLEMFGPAPDKLSPVEDEEVEDVTTFCLVPSSAGKYELHVTFGGEEVTNNPFIVPVRDITKVFVSGSGVTGNGTCVMKPADVIVDISEAGMGPIIAQVTNPSGQAEILTLDNKEELVFEGSYLPEEPGYYGVEVKFDDEAVSNSPYLVPIGQPEKVILDGEGLEYAFVGLDNVIDCYTKQAGPGHITAEFTSPPEASPVNYHVIKIDNDHQEVHYQVDTLGQYKVNLCYNEFPIENKPRNIQAIDLNRCTISGPGISPGILAKIPTYFEVDVQEAGKGNLQVFILSPDDEDIPVQIVEISEGVFKVNYTPTTAGNHVINISCNGNDIDQSPIFVTTADPEKVKCSGLGLSHAIVNEPTEFKVDVMEAGEGSLNIQINGPEEVSEIECTRINNTDPYNVTYNAPRAGLYEIHVKFAEVHVNGSPFEVECQRPVPDATKCKVFGLENLGNFTVDSREAGGTGLLEVGVCGSYVPANFISVKHNGDYTFNVSYDISEPGQITISVKWHGEHLAGSPFIVCKD